MKFIYGCLLLAACASMAGADEVSPLITHVAPVAPDILGITVETGRVEFGKQVPYVRQEGDAVEEWAKHLKGGFLKRNGKRVGGIVGPGGKILRPFDRLVGKPLNMEWAEKTESYRLSSPDDPDYRAETAPTAVHRKSRPSNLAQIDGFDFQAQMEHLLYLKLPKPLKAGKRYRLTFSGENLPAHSFAFEPSRMRSEAVHVNQLGFRPDDPVKIAYLSCWMGRGGGVKYAPGTRFQILENGSGQAVYEGRIRLSKAADDKTEDVYNRNYNGTDVYAIEFTPLNRPGKYRVYVEGIGCSYPFEIGAEVWRKAFIVSARSLYHQRSGIPLEPPYATFKRPRPFHPADGMVIYHSKTGLIDSGNGLNAKGTDKDNFGNLVAGKTDQVVPNAWGGYFDAGDWDRRIQHLEATRLLLELAELFPGYFASVSLNIPETGNGLPDIVNEALWNLDFFRRLQTPEGGIRGGIESEEHPQFGEASWQESLTVMAYAPDCWSSYVYTGDAARAAFWLQSRKPALAKIYRESALRAMAWAEEDYQKRRSEKLPHEVNDARNLAALELFRLTGEKRWHDLFLETTVFKEPNSELHVWKSHQQSDAAFLYLRTRRPGMEESVRKNCLNALEKTAVDCLNWSQKTGFGWTKNLTSWQPTGWGVLAVPQAINLLRAHAVTGKSEYLRAAVLASQTGAGANPVNMCYTTGLGSRSPQNPLVVDSRMAGMPVPPGITVYGPTDMTAMKDGWEVKLVSRFSFPPAVEWPVIEAYFDICWFPNICEFTVMQTLGPNAYVWGYLAARK